MLLKEIGTIRLLVLQDVPRKEGPSYFLGSPSLRFIFAVIDGERDKQMSHSHPKQKAALLTIYSPSGGFLKRHVPQLGYKPTMCIHTHNTHLGHIPSAL